MIYAFNDYTLDTERFSLAYQEETVALEPLVFDLLVYLVVNRARVVPRDELLEALWTGKVVSDAALAARLKDARRAIGDSGSRQAAIKTVHGRGYQFVAEVTEDASPPHAFEAVIDRPDFLDLPEKPSIAILPFTNQTRQAEYEFLCDGLTDDLITTLTRVPELFVVARHSTEVYKDSRVDVRQVGREQGVGYVLEGGLQVSNQRARVNAQLSDAQSGRQLWADRYDGELADVFRLQDELSRQITIALQVQLTEGTQAREMSGGTDSFEAWELTLRARRLMERHVREENFVAQRLATRALECDSNYAAAWAVLGFTHWENERWGWVESTGSPLEQAKQAAARALQLDAADADAIALDGLIKIFSQQPEAARDVLEYGVELYPSHSWLIAVCALAYRSLCEYETAWRRIQRAIRLCPIFPAWYLMVAGSVHMFQGKSEASVEMLREAVRREPDSNLSRIWLLHALIKAGEKAEWQALAQEIRKIEPTLSIADWIDSVSPVDPAIRNRLFENFKCAGFE